MKYLILVASLILMGCVSRDKTESVLSKSRYVQYKLSGEGTSVAVDSSGQVWILRHNLGGEIVREMKAFKACGE